MTESNMQLAFQCQCYDGVDCAEKCVDKFNCEILYALSSKSFDTIKSTFIVMLPKWLGDLKFDKGASNKHISMNTIPPKKQHIQQTAVHDSNSFTMMNHKQIIVRMDCIKKCGIGQNCHTTDDQVNDRAFFTQLIGNCNSNSKSRISSNSNINSNDNGNGNTNSNCSNNCNRFSNSFDQSPPRMWSKNATVPRQSIHSQLLCNKHYVKTYRNDVNGVAEIMHKQRYSNLSSTKITYDTSTIGTDHGNGCADEQFSTTTAGTATVRVATTKAATAAAAANKYTIGRKMSGKYIVPPAAKPSLKIVQRSPLISAHRANFMQIFIKYLLILNCLMCFVNGNLMSRNMGNDLSSKHNQSNADTPAITTPLNSSTSIGSNRKAILTTSSPLIPHSIITTSNRSQFQSPTLQSQDSERVKHFLHQHAQEALTSNSYISDEPASSYKLPNGDGSSEEFSRCTSCQFREQLKAQNLASIKMHILARLSMTHPPNITGRPHISEQILQTFYENNDFRYIRIRNDSIDEMNEMQGDDPIASNGQHQHHHLHEYHRNGGIKTGLHEQHHHHHNRHSRIDNEYNEEYDYSDRGGIVYNMDYYDEPRSPSRSHYDDVPPPYDNVEETEEAFYSTTDIIYSFPKLSKARHRGDILEFTVKNNNHLSVSGATFNLYVRGEDWINENEPNVWMRNGHLNNGRSNMGGIHIDDNVMGSSTVSAGARDDHNFATSSDTFHKLHGNGNGNGNGKNVNNNHISISINRFVHRHQQQQNTNDQEQSKKSAQPTHHQQPQQQQHQHQPPSLPQQQQQQQRYTRIDSNFVGEIPKGAGEWIQFNITLMVSEWIEQQKHQSVNTQSTDIVQEVVIKTLEPWMRQLLVLDTNSKNRPYIEIQTRDMRKHRTKRHLAKDCRENDRQSRCCRYPLRVDFRKFGWDWIIAPDIYEAYYCAGECPIGFLPKHPHTYIYSLSSSYSTCCSPRKLSPLSLLYFDDNKNVIHSIIPNMAVEKCGCS